MRTAGCDVYDILNVNLYMCIEEFHIHVYTVSTPIKGDTYLIVYINVFIDL